MPSHLVSARYGKDNVRLYKVYRDPTSNEQTVVEMTVCILLEGEIDASYTEADNSVVVATDSIKNTIYILARQHPITPPELFASLLGSHFVEKYKHIHVAHVNIVTHRWARMEINGTPHPHSFVKDGEETRTVQADVTDNHSHSHSQNPSDGEAAAAVAGISIRTGIRGLTVLKSTNSQFWGFVRDEYTTLPETWDRVLSTDVAADWQWKRFRDMDEVRSHVDQFDETWKTAREVTMRIFAEDNSASVQNTMYKMADEILGYQALVDTVEYSLPNKHYFEIDLSWHNGLKNTGQDAEVYAPQTNPNGLIKCTVGRADAGKAKL